MAQMVVTGEAARPMGGILPLGYDLPAPGTRTLVVNEAEAETVRHIFTRYLALGSVWTLADELATDGILSKQRITFAGKVSGGKPFSRGALFHLLGNPLYLGKITHGKLIHDGSHPAIVDVDLFDAVRQQIDNQARRHRAKRERPAEKAPLGGRIFDANGEVMTPAFSRGRGGRIYRYYVSASLQQGPADADDGVIRRVAAPAIES